MRSELFFKEMDEAVQAFTFLFPSSLYFLLPQLQSYCQDLMQHPKQGLLFQEIKRIKETHLPFEFWKKELLGVLGEYLIYRYFLSRHFFCLARNWKQSWAELDLVFRKNKACYFCEVKTSLHKTFPEKDSFENLAVYRINARKINKLLRLQTAFQEHYVLKDCSRLDAEIYFCSVDVFSLPSIQLSHSESFFTKKKKASFLKIGKDIDYLFPNKYGYTSAYEVYLHIYPLEN